MTNLEKIAQSEMKYSPQAQTLVAMLKEELFDVDAFEAWQSERFIAGGADVIEFVQMRKNALAHNEEKHALE